MKNKKFKAMGVLGIAGGVGLEIEIDAENERAGTKFMDKINRWQNIKELDNGECYIVFGGRKYLLNEFIRTDLGRSL